MVKQEEATSCGAACVRQLLLDAGVDIPEAQIRTNVGFISGQNIPADWLRDQLNELHQGASYKSATVWPEDLPKLAMVVPFIALIRVPSKHFVIVGKITDDEVLVRDPGSACEGVLNRADFVRRWEDAGNGTIYRVKSGLSWISTRSSSSSNR